jgi:hypothetical protein
MHRGARHGRVHVVRLCGRCSRRGRIARGRSSAPLGRLLARSALADFLPRCAHCTIVSIVGMRSRLPQRRERRPPWPGR